MGSWKRREVSADNATACARRQGKKRRGRGVGEDDKQASTNQKKKNESSSKEEEEWGGERPRKGGEASWTSLLLERAFIAGPTGKSDANGDEECLLTLLTEKRRQTEAQ
jgi:hypothetical protein